MNLIKIVESTVNKITEIFRLVSGPGKKEGRGGESAFAKASADEEGDWENWEERKGEWERGRIGEREIGRVGMIGIWTDGERTQNPKQETRNPKSELRNYITPLLL